MHTLWDNMMSQSVGSTLALPDQTVQVQLIPVGLRKTSLLLLQIPTVILHKTARTTLPVLQLTKVGANTILENSGNPHSLKLVHTKRSCPTAIREIRTNFSLPAHQSHITVRSFFVFLGFFSSSFFLHHKCRGEGRRNIFCLDGLIPY